VLGGAVGVFSDGIGRNLPFLAGVGEPVVRPEVARILRRPGMGSDSCEEGNPIRVFGPRWRIR